MRITTPITLILVGLLAWPFDAKAQADFRKAGDILTHCKRFLSRDVSESDYVDAVSCHRFVTGVTEGLRAGAMIAAKKIYGAESVVSHYQRLMLYCIPKGVKQGQGTRVVVKYLETHPEKLHKSAIVLIAFAFEEAFPCK